MHRAHAFFVNLLGRYHRYLTTVRMHVQPSFLKLCFYRPILFYRQYNGCVRQPVPSANGRAQLYAARSRCSERLTPRVSNVLPSSTATTGFLCVMSCLASRLRHRHNTTQTNIVPAYQLVPRSCKPALDAATYQSARRDILADFAKGVVLQVVFQRILARIGTAVAAYALRPDRALRQPKYNVYKLARHCGEARPADGTGSDLGHRFSS